MRRVSIPELRAGVYDTCAAGGTHNVKVLEASISILISNAEKSSSLAGLIIVCGVASAFYTTFIKTNPKRILCFEDRLSGNLRFKKFVKIINVKVDFFC